MLGTGWAERAIAELAPVEHVSAKWATPGEMAQALDPATLQTPALNAIDTALMDVLTGRVRKQIIASPPQIGKSQRVSRRFPLYALMHDPTLRVVIVSATLPLAERWGRQIRADIREHPELGITLREDSNSAKRWETQRGGSLFCTGWTSGTVGQPTDLLIIDDPIASRQEAESAATRSALWDFWENDAGTRARKAIVMATRWRTDDLSGQLMEKEPGQWSVLTIPAVSEGPGDPLNRPEGVELESANPELHGPGYFHDKQKTVSSYVWNSLYQGRPTAASGNLFLRDGWLYWTPGETDAHGRSKISVSGTEWSLSECMRFMTMDLATSTKTSADYTVACCWAIPPTGDLVLLDWKRERVPETDHAGFIAPMRSRWLDRGDVVYVESRMFGTTLVWQMGKQGVPTRELKADTDKVTRALPAAGLQREGRVFLPKNAHADKLEQLKDELADFPSSRHDDTVDAVAYAARVRLTHWLAPQTHEQDRAVATPDPYDGVLAGVFPEQMNPFGGMNF